MKNPFIDRAAGKIRPWDWILVIGLMLAPMTGLRIWKIGPAEVLCLIWGIRNYNLARLPIKNDLSRFIIFYLLAMVVGTIIGTYVAPDELVWSQWPTWPYLFFITYGIFLGVRKNSKVYNEHLLDVICQLCVVWYLILYFYSITISRTFLGAPLWFAGARYTGGANNPHQVAVLMCGVVFWFVRQVLKKKHAVLNLMMAVLAVYVEWQTDSATGTAAIAAGILVLIFLIPVRANISVRRKGLILFAEALVIAIVVALTYQKIFEFITGWILSDKNGLGRINLISQLGEVFMKSPIFGLGPGVHALNLAGNPLEFHNTYSEILAASGIAGMTAFLILTYKTLRYMMRDQYLIPIMVSLYVYGLGGFAMRRLAYWGIFTLIYVIATQSYREARQEALEDACEEPELIEDGEEDLSDEPAFEPEC